MGVTAYQTLISSIIVFILGVLLSSYGAPSSPEEATIDWGNKVNDALAKQSDNEHVQNVAQSNRTTYRILGIGFSITSLLLFAISLVLVLTGRGNEEFPPSQH